MRKVPNNFRDKKVTFTDITSGDPQGVMKSYNLNSVQFEQQVMKHAGRDIPQNERRSLYHEAYDKHRGRGGYK